MTGYHVPLELMYVLPKGKTKKEAVVMNDFTTMEHLELSLSTGEAAIQYGDKVLVATLNCCKGTYEAEIYEFVDEPDDGLDRIECRLALIKKSETQFKDGGHAMQWSLEKMN
jgi:hypothetical protein